MSKNKKPSAPESESPAEFEQPTVDSAPPPEAVQSDSPPDEAPAAESAADITTSDDAGEVKTKTVGDELPPPLPSQPRAYEVGLTPHNPGTRIVLATNEAEALEVYYRSMGIVQSDNMPKIVLLPDVPVEV